MWSFWVCLFLINNDAEPDYYFTRSDWVLFFLSLRNKKVIFECHQYSKVRKFVINKAIKRPRTKIVFLSENLCKRFELEGIPSSNSNLIDFHSGKTIFVRGLFIALLITKFSKL